MDSPPGMLGAPDTMQELRRKLEAALRERALERAGPLTGVHEGARAGVAPRTPLDGPVQRRVRAADASP